MDEKAMFKLSYGLFVLTARQQDRDNGCIINTALQVTADPNRICVVINKANLTHDMILETGFFSISVMSTEADFSLFKRFGFQSGRDVNKFEDFSDYGRAKNGTVFITEGTNAYISGEVEQSIDIGSHTLFISKVTDMKILSEASSATYDYYQKHIKPKPEPVGKSKEGKTIWRCTVCAYEYEGEELPDDFICPICKHPAADFEKVTG